MRQLPYFSPTSLSLFHQSLEEFYTKYLADQSPPPIPQTQPMSVGSSFDAYVKAFLYERLFGKKDPRFEFQTIFEAQVESQNRDFARDAGQYCFNQYKEYGSLTDMIQELEQAGTDPKFEFTVENRVSHTSCVEGIPFSGKPDIFFHTKDGRAVIYDWKVNGYCSKSNISPAKGYVMIRGDLSYKNLYKPHKDAQVIMESGIQINAAMTLEQVNEDWANQLSIYAWILGEEVGSGFIAGIDQLVFGENDGITKPKCRVARHRCKVNKAYQEEIYKRAAIAWEIINSKHIFREMSEMDSLRRCQMLDQVHQAYGDPNDPKEQWFREATRQHKNY